MEILAKRDKKPLIITLVIAVITLISSYNGMGFKNVPTFGTAIYLMSLVVFVATVIMAVGCAIFILDKRAMVSREGDKLTLAVGFRREEISIADIISVEGDDPKNDPIRLQSGTLSFKVRAADGERSIFLGGVLDAKAAAAKVMTLVKNSHPQENANA